MSKRKFSLESVWEQNERSQKIAKSTSVALENSIRVLDSIRISELKVKDIVSFNEESEHLLVKLLFLEIIQKACLGKDLPSFSGVLMSVFEDKSSRLLDDNVQQFVATMATLAPDRGLQVPLVTLVAQVEVLMDDSTDPEALISLFQSMSESVVSKLCATLNKLVQVAKHPCCRGDGCIDADALYPHIQKIESKSTAPTLLELLPLLQLLHENIGINCRNQMHSREWMSFNDTFLQPFLRNNAAIDEWLDPHLFVISAAGPPPVEVTQAINSIRVAGDVPAGVTVTTRPVVFTSLPQFLATPCLFRVTDASAAHDNGLLLRHGKNGLPGPNAQAAGTNYQVVHLNTTNMNLF